MVQMSLLLSCSSHVTCYLNFFDLLAEQQHLLSTWMKFTATDREEPNTVGYYRPHSEQATAASHAFRRPFETQN